MYTQYSLYSRSAFAVVCLNVLLIYVLPSIYIQCKEPLSGGTENQVIESPISRDDIDERQRYSSNFSSLNQQPSSVGMNADFSSTGSNHGTEYRPCIITSPSSMGSSLPYPLQYTTGSSDTLFTFKEKMTVVQSGLISQVRLSYYHYTPFS